MKGISRRARACAVVAATGVAVLAGSTAAQAQRPASDRRRYADRPGRASRCSTSAATSATAATRAPRTRSPASSRRTVPRRRTHRRRCRLRTPRRRCSRSSSARARRTSSSSATPASRPDTTSRASSRYRALLDKYGLHAGGWHGSVNEWPAWTERVTAAKILGLDYIGSGGLASPGIGTYANTLRTAETLNRLGKELGRGRRRPGLHPQPHRRVRRQVRRQRRPEVRVADPDGPHRRPLRRGRGRRLLVLGRVQRRHRHRDRGAASTRYPTRVKMMHVKDGINIGAAAEPDQQPRRLAARPGTGELDFRPIFAAAQATASSTTTTSRTAARSPTPTSASRTSRAIGTAVVRHGPRPADRRSRRRRRHRGRRERRRRQDQEHGRRAADHHRTRSRPRRRHRRRRLLDRQPARCAARRPRLASPATRCRRPTPAVPRGTCIVNVGFKPTRRTHAPSPACSSPRTPTTRPSRSCSTGTSTATPLGSVGGDVAVARSR